MDAFLEDKTKFDSMAFYELWDILIMLVKREIRMTNIKSDGFSNYIKKITDKTSKYESSFQGEGNNFGLDITNTNLYEDDVNICGLDQDILRRNVQRKIIMELIKHPGKSVTFFGHVPLFTCRLKKGENIGSLCNNSELIFKDIFNHSKISKLLLNTKYVYYICADTHYYQQSMITLKSGVVLTQYIVGTGGANLDVHSDEIGLCLPTKKVKNAT